MEQGFTGGEEHRGEERYRGMVFRGHSRQQRQATHKQARATPHRGSLHQATAGRLLAKPRAEAAPLAEEEREFLRRAFAHACLREGDYRLAPLRRRLTAGMRAIGARSLAEARLRLAADARRWSDVIDGLLIGTTEFMRDRAVFEQLGDMLPALAVGGVGLRVWSMGCSDGAELYSVGMLLGERGLLPGSRLRGTDCRPAALARAAAGRFSAAAAEAVVPELRKKYVRADGAGVVITPALLDRTEWELGDAMRCDEENAWDVILCRNLAIYLVADAVHELWTRMARALRPGGLLVVGKADRPSVAGLRRMGPCIYVRGDNGQHR